MTIIATCATIAAALASAQGGETISLKGDCPAIRVAKKYPSPVTVNAEGSTVRGLTITGSNIRWRSGRLVAPNGAFTTGPLGYAVKIAGEKVVLDGVMVTAAKKGVVIDGAREVKIIRTQFVRLGEDGVIASRVAGLHIVGSSFEQTIGKPTACLVKGKKSLDVAKRDCVGTWTDGFHADAVQMRNGVTDALIEGNTVRGATQGLTQMDTKGDLPLQRVVIRQNVVTTTGYHSITLANCIGCRIEGNEVRRQAGATKRAVIIPGQALRCGNLAPDDKVRDRPCTAR